MKKDNELHLLSDAEILAGFKHSDSKIVREYFYGYCRVAYCIYDRRYDLRNKPGTDFFSLAHEYFLYLYERQFRPLEDRHTNMSLKTWMVNGFRYLLLDKLKAAEKEHRFESFEARFENRNMKFDITDNSFEQELYRAIEDIGNQYYGRDSKNAIILKMLYIEGFKGKDVALQLGMTASAVTQRCQKMMHEVVIPYFKKYFTASEYEPRTLVCDEEVSAPAFCAVSDMAKSCIADNDILAEDTEYIHSLPSSLIKGKFMKYMKNRNGMEKSRNNRMTPHRIETLKENEIFVFGSNLAGMHGGGAARTACLHFGAVMGQGVGMQGQSYAIPTMQGGVETIRPYVDDFIAFAQTRPDKQFLVTPIGCGIAGFDAEDIAPLFAAAVEVGNISLPECFWKVIG